MNQLLQTHVNPKNTCNITFSPITVENIQERAESDRHSQFVQLKNKIVISSNTIGQK